MRRPGITGAVALALPVMALAAYWRALRGCFLWDDDGRVMRAELQPLHGLANALANSGRLPEAADEFTAARSASLQ